GLTRADPTLQVYYGRPERNTSLDVTASDAAFPEGDNFRMAFAFSSPDGAYYAPGISDAEPSLPVYWNGPAETQGNAHALYVQREPGSIDGPPLSYVAYDSAAVSLSDGDADDDVLGLDLSADVLGTVNIAGSVDSGQFGSHIHRLAMRFDDGTVLPLLASESNQAPFSFLVPVLPEATLTVAASSNVVGYVVAHTDGVPAAADQNVDLVLPRPVAPNAPANGGTAGPGTTFSWSTVGQSARVFVWHLESEGFVEGIYVITSESSIELPQVPGFSVTLPDPDDEWAFYWSVETHGDFASVDAATGPEGLFDSYALDKDLGTGPLRGSQGYYTNSDIRSVNLSAQ
ncbi:MAG TPA: hypothetical protein VMG12_27155, partial [Polyangiaceae bacterium]|nr:hypothetical protein [Polyangiaceae bacterium]